MVLGTYPALALSGLAVFLLGMGLLLVLLGVAASSLIVIVDQLHHGKDR